MKSIRLNLLILYLQALSLCPKKMKWQVRQDSNPQPAVLETAALAS